MLSMLICSGRTALEDGPDAPLNPPRRNGSRRSERSSSKRKVSKMQIGGPVGFRHEAHVGYEDMTGTENWDVNRWQQELEVRSNASSYTRSPQTPNFVIPMPKDLQQPSYQLSTSAPAATGGRGATNLGRTPTLLGAPVKRKPVPSTSTVEPSSSSLPVSESNSTPIASYYARKRRTSSNGSTSFFSSENADAQSQARSIAGPDHTPKVLVPLLDPPPQRRTGISASSSAPIPGEPHYVTQTTKIRWDGAMAEIGRALKETN